ncbi:MAG: hypothetical protein AB7P76_05010 [Candidatus Melainabacteria bacterium]
MPATSERHTYRLSYTPTDGRSLTSDWLAGALQPFREAGITLSELFVHCGCGEYNHAAYGPVTLVMVFQATGAASLQSALEATLPGCRLQQLT